MAVLLKAFKDDERPAVWQAAAMDFQVLVDGRLRTINLAFGSERDLRSISHWRIAPSATRQPAVRDTIV